MPKQFEVVFGSSGEAVAFDLLEDKAPLTCENFWEGIESPRQDALHHGGETGAEMWCFVAPPKEELPYENSTVFPEHGEVLYYHYRQPPTRDGEMIYDIGIYWDRGQSKVAAGWLCGNLFARLADPADVTKLRREAGRLLAGEQTTITLRRKG